MPVDVGQTERTVDYLADEIRIDHFFSHSEPDKIGREYRLGRGVPVFAVRLGQDPYGFIGRFQAFNGLGKSPAILAADLFSAYRKHKQTQAMMPDILVRLLEKSLSFESARVRTGYLEELESWPPSFTKRIIAAVKNNSQVGSSWGVPSRLESLVEKWDPAAKKESDAAPDDDEIPF